MRSFWSDPYLWIHLAGVASVPLWLELCLLGLAVGDPILPVWLELFLVGATGIVPILWMQWQRPFDIYSLLAIALRPERLTEEQRKLLTLFTAQRNQYLAIVVAIALAFVLQKLYLLAPIAAGITPFAANGRLVGLLVATIAFLGANLFLQVPVAVLSVLLTSEATYAVTQPFAPEQIRQRFLLLGWPVNQILPPLTTEPPARSAMVATSSAQASASNSTDPSIPSAPPNHQPLEPTATNSDDLEDIWATAEAASVIEPPISSNLVAEPVPEMSQTAPDEKPDLTLPDVKTEAVTTESDNLATASTPNEMPEAQDDTLAGADQAWLDTAVLIDPASAEPPNSL